MIIKVALTYHHGGWFTGVIEDGVIVALAHPDYARRIAHLLDTYGLVDVPDTIEGLET